MAGCACRLGHLAVVDAIAERDHLLRRAGRDRKTGSRTGILIGPFGWLGFGLNDFTGRGRQVGAWGNAGITGFRAGGANIGDFVDPAFYIVRDIKRSVRTDRDAGWTIRGALRSPYRTCEAV